MNRELDTLADRHLRADPQGQLAPAADAQEARVLIAITPAVAQTTAGQHAIWMLANLICRQFKLVTGIVLDIPPDVPLRPRVAAFGGAATLKETVEGCVRLVAGKHVELAEWEGAAIPIEICVGSPSGKSRATHRLVLFADGWRLFLGSVFSSDRLPSSPLPFGPYLAACFAAGEVFKRLRGMKSGRGEFLGHGRDLCLSLWTMRSAPAWDQLDPDSAIWPIRLPPFYFAGAGAVAEAAALTLGAIPDISAHIVVIDPEPLDLSNGNRYALATVDNDKALKASLMAEFLEHRGFTVRDHEQKWQDYVTRRNRAPSRADLDLLEADYRYNLILSCVDDNGARHALQNLWPHLIIGGSTDGLTAKAITYDMERGELCLKCFNPVIERNDLVKARFEEAKKMDAAARAKFFADHGLDPAKAELYLSDPRCGELSEEDLDRFAAGPPMMSVGFVSVAAGILLAAQTVRFVEQGREKLTEKGAMLIVNFYRPGIRWLPSLPQDGCDCADRRITYWRERWRPA